MSRFVITPAADADLDEIWWYIAGESGTERADRIDDELHEAMGRIGEMPGIGHLRQDLADEDLRFLQLHRLLIIYRPETQPAQIIRVLHSARDVRAILGGH